jgi:hypothetical protein
MPDRMAEKWERWAEERNLSYFPEKDSRAEGNWKSG